MTMLPSYKTAFLDFALEQGVMRFGEFELKSGRLSPYFFNAGLFNTGAALRRLGGFYADALEDSGIACDCLFGPAYKGIPLVSAAAIAMSERYQKDIPYVFNRKEAKDHGEGGQLVGSELKGDVIIVDDVITAGTAIREVMTLFEGTAAIAAGVMVAIDRQERGTGELSAIQEVERDYGFSVISVVKLEDIVEYLSNKGQYQQEIDNIMRYREQYGIKAA